MTPLAQTWLFLGVLAFVFAAAPAVGWLLDVAYCYFNREAVVAMREAEADAMIALAEKGGRDAS